MDATSAALDAVFSLAKDKSTRQVAAEQQGLAEAVKAVGERIEGMSAEDRDAWREASVLVKLLARFFAAHST